MKKRLILVVPLVMLIGVFIMITLLHNGVFDNDIKDITSEKNYTIQNQEKVEVTFSIPKAKLSDEIYSSEGQSFAENEIIVYQTDTTAIYLDRIMLSNESGTQLYFMFNCSYELPNDGSVLVPYKKNDDNSYTYEIDLASKDLTDKDTIYKEAISLRGVGPSEQFAFYVSTDACKEAVETLNINLFINQMTYGGI